MSAHICPRFGNEFNGHWHNLCGAGSTVELRGADALFNRTTMTRKHLTAKEERKHAMIGRPVYDVYLLARATRSFLSVWSPAPHTRSNKASQRAKLGLKA